MRRALLALTGMVAGTTLLISVKSAPGAIRLPAQVAADEARAAALAAAAAASAAASPGPSPLPGASGQPSAPVVVPGLTSGPVVTTTTTRPAAGPQPQPKPTSPVAPPPPPPPPPGPGPIAGDSVYTEFGYVQVGITVSNGRITDVINIELPADEARSVSISERAGPMLRQRALEAQSAQIETVSGTTWTSDGYRTSLQSALDKAGL